MFGHHDDKDNPEGSESIQPDAATAVAADEGAEQTQAADQPMGDGAGPAVTQPDQPDPSTDSSASDSGDNQDEAQPADDDSENKSQAWQHPGTPSADNTDNADNKDQISDIISPAGGFPKRPSYQYAQGAQLSVPADNGAKATNPADSELIDIRQQALDELAPLMDKLELQPEDKFRILMMIIQTHDDQDRIKEAYEAAHAIKDETAKAQALLEIVNEVNYFTQEGHHEEPESED